MTLSRAVVLYTPALIALLVGSSRFGTSTAFIVDLIPEGSSAEHAPNAEPTVTVNGTNSNQLAAAAHHTGKDFCKKKTRVASFFSTDGGLSWDIVCNIAKKPNHLAGDFSLRFAGNGHTLYLGYLLDGSGNGRLAQTSAFSSPAVATTVFDKPDIDQPQVRTMLNPGSDQFVIGARNSDLYSDNPAKPCVGFSVFGSPFAASEPQLDDDVCADKRLMPGEAGTGMRVTVHPDGTVYATLYAGRSLNSDLVDVVVTRGDSPSHLTTHAMEQLADVPLGGNTNCDVGDGKIGYRVARCVTYLSSLYNDPQFGCQALGNSNAIVVDPRPGKSNHVYLVWGDKTSASKQTLHLAESLNQGASLVDLKKIPNGTNPALAVDSQGRLGFLYQTLVTEDNTQRWQTWIEIGGERFTSPQKTLLADAPVDVSNCPSEHPFVGDYFDLGAAGTTFYGVFAAPNDNKPGRFPAGVKFQRRMQGNLPVDLDGSHVTVSIDPFFFRIQ